MDTDRGKSKTKRRPYMQLFTSDYRDGTARLSFELQGFYFRILTYLHDGDDVPSDPIALATFLQCSPRTTRAHLPKLLSAGKLYEVNGTLRNKRIDRDLNANSPPLETEFAPTSNPTQPEVEPSSPRTFQKCEQNQQSKNCTMEDSTSISNSRRDLELAAPPVPEPARPSPSGAALPGLVDRLIDACNGSLDNPVNCMGLLSEATPRMWLSQGADLELDVIPTLQAAGKRYHGKRIRDWNYFTPMIADAKAKRLAPMPEGKAAPHVPEWKAEKQRRARELMALCDKLDQDRIAARGARQ